MFAKIRDNSSSFAKLINILLNKQQLYIKSELHINYWLVIYSNLLIIFASNITNYWIYKRILKDEEKVQIPKVLSYICENWKAHSHKPPFLIQESLISYDGQI